VKRHVSQTLTKKKEEHHVALSRTGKGGVGIDRVTHLEWEEGGSEIWVEFGITSAVQGSAKESAITRTRRRPLLNFVVNVASKPGE